MKITTIPIRRDDQIATAIKNQYETENYDVVVAPDGNILPENMTFIHPDLIARNGSECLVIEIKHPDLMRGIDYWTRAKDAVESVPGWKYVVVVPGDGEESLDDTDLSLQKINSLVTETELLLRSHHNNAALLTSWIAFELALKNSAQRHHIPTRVPTLSTLMAAMYDEGEIDPDDYIHLRAVLSLRNKVVHGQHVDPVSHTDVKAVVSKVRELIAA